MIRTPWNISCEVNYRRAQIKHAFLENDIRDVSAKNRANYWLNDVTKVKNFQGSIKIADNLAREMVDGFSPRQLVDNLEPLQCLDNETRSAIKEAVHQVYLETSGIVELNEEYKAGLDAFKKVFDPFLELWKSLERISTNKHFIEEAWPQVQESSKPFHAIMEKLPMGVVLP